MGHLALDLNPGSKSPEVITSTSIPTAKRSMSQSKPKGRTSASHPHHRFHQSVRYSRDRRVRREELQCRSSQSDASRIRSRYLHLLGLEPPKDSRVIEIRHNVGNNNRDVFSIDLLKDDNGTTDDTLAVGSPPIQLSFSPRKRAVSFQSTVVVHKIPSRYAYSERLKKLLWMRPSEFWEAVARNSLEYMSEGCDPEKVLEESDFVPYHGELVHPIYFNLEYAGDKVTKSDE